MCSNNYLFTVDTTSNSTLTNWIVEIRQLVKASWVGMKKKSAPNNKQPLRMEQKRERERNKNNGSDKDEMLSLDGEGREGDESEKKRETETTM